MDVIFRHVELLDGVLFSHFSLNLTVIRTKKVKRFHEFFTIYCFSESFYLFKIVLWCRNPYFVVFSFVFHSIWESRKFPWRFWSKQFAMSFIQVHFRCHSRPIGDSLREGRICLAFHRSLGNRLSLVSHVFLLLLLLFIEPNSN